MWRAVLSEKAKVPVIDDRSPSKVMADLDICQVKEDNNYACDGREG